MVFSTLEVFIKVLLTWASFPWGAVLHNGVSYDFGSCLHELFFGIMSCYSSNANLAFTIFFLSYSCNLPGWQHSEASLLLFYLVSIMISSVGSVTLC